MPLDCPSTSTGSTKEEVSARTARTTPWESTARNAFQVTTDRMGRVQHKKMHVNVVDVMSLPTQETVQTTLVFVNAKLILNHPFAISVLMDILDSRLVRIAHAI